MCVIIVCQKRNITDKEMEKMWAGNPHGAGMAWISKAGKVCFKKGITKLADLKAFYHSRKFRLPHVVHFRIATVGAIMPELTQPFICSPNSPIRMDHEGDEKVLFHNGTYRDWETILATTAIATETRVLGPVNDSRLAAILQHFVPAMLNNIATETRNLFALLSKKGCTIIGHFDEVDGILCSNLHWKESRKVIQGAGGKGHSDRSDYQQWLSDMGPTASFKEAKHHDSDDVLKVTPRFRSQFLHSDFEVISGD